MAVPRSAPLAAVVMALGCLSQPVRVDGAAPVQTAAPSKVEASAPIPNPCLCLEDLSAADAARHPPAPQTDSAPEAERRSGALIRVVTGAGGIITGNPPAWALIGQVAYLAVHLFGRRRRTTA